MTARIAALSLATTDFWDHIERICEVVDAQIKAKDTDLRAIPLTVQRELAPDRLLLRTLIEDLLGFVEALQGIRVLQRRELADPGAPRASNFRTPSPASYVGKLKRWFGFDKLSKNPDMDALLRACRDKLTDTKRKEVGAAEFERRGDEVLMEYLTAAWLALYFLGMPFIHPWEQVRRMGDARGGFPSGGCIAKYVGDVYRYERRRLEQDPKARAESSMLVLSHVPYVLLPALINCPDDDDLTPRCAHVLGRLYAALQMRLYFNSGLRAHFVIPVESLTRALARLEKVGSPESLIKGIEAWLHTLFDGGGNQQRVTLLTRTSATAGLPTCILGPRVGVYSLESGNSGLHFSGNQLHDALLDSYRTKLEKLAAESEHELIELLPTDGAVATKVTALIDEERCTTAGAPPQQA
jgi:hypothetical protein